jgi:hypothetical protein
MALVIDDTLISNQEQNLRAAMSTDPKMRKVMQQHIREALFAARRDVIDAFPAESDPREARRAIRTSVYDKVLGGNINILTGKKAHGTNNYEPQRTLTPGQRGGNRRKRSERTKQIMSYAPLDRGFILRFLEGGARKGGGRRQERGFRNDPHRDQVKRGSQGGDISKYGKTTNTGSRGSISARHVFSGVAEHGMSNAIAFIEREIDKLIQQEFGNG